MSGLLAKLTAALPGSGRHERVLQAGARARCVCVERKVTKLSQRAGFNHARLWWWWYVFEARPPDAPAFVFRQRILGGIYDVGDWAECAYDPADPTGATVLPGEPEFVREMREDEQRRTRELRQRMDAAVAEPANIDAIASLHDRMRAGEITYQQYYEEIARLDAGG